MRIALLSTDPSPGRRDIVSPLEQVADHVEALAGSLAAIGHEVTLLRSSVRPQEPDSYRHPDGFDSVRLAGPDSGPRPAVGDQATALSGALGRWFQRSPQDVIHAHSWLAALALAIAPDPVKAPVVLSFHDPRRIEGVRSVRGIVRGLASMAAVVVAGSSPERELLASWGVPRRSMRVLTSGVDTSTYRRVPPVGSTGLRILAPGPAAQAGLGVLLHALRLLPDATLTVTSDATGADRVTLSRLAEAARRGRLAERIHILDPAHRRRIGAARLLHDADLVTFLRPADPTAGDALRAMACGRAVLATAVDALADAVVPGVTGELVAPGRPITVVAHLRDLALDRFAREAYGVAGADRAMTRYTWDRVAAEHVRLYATVSRSSVPPEPATLGSAD